MAQIKTKEEIQKIKKACVITDKIFNSIISNFAFSTEIELQKYILSEIKKRGLRPSFPPIVTSGKRAGNDIHPKPTDKVLEGFVIIDFGVVYEAYMSDMTRTIYVGKPSSEDIKLYITVREAKSNAEKYIFPNIKVAISDLVARQTMGDINQYFIHTLGHGVGKKIHESPKLYWKNKRAAFKNNMVVTVEPGIYIPNSLGIRIEDTGVVTPRGYVHLTKSTQDLVVFKNIMI